jgi:sarcosine oxidase subunit gamma
MSETHRPESPLTHVLAGLRRRPRLERAGVNLRERPFLGHIVLRANPADCVSAAMTESLGVIVPSVPNTVAFGLDATVLCLGPDEWLLLTAPGCEILLADRVRNALKGVHSAIADVTSGHTVVRLSGPNAGDVLAKGCTVDIHPRVFSRGQCSQTRIAKAGVILLPADESGAFDIVVRRSFAEYLAMWLADAALEYGLRIDEDQADRQSISTVEPTDRARVLTR